MGSVALEGFGGGGGTSLNFKVICNPQPSTAKENTIWVDTDKIKNYYFSATQPENMVDYDVWFTIGTSSSVAFSATKKNPIMVYPLTAKQYIGGALENKTAKSYQNGEWVDWITYLYNNGNECTSITGGWVGMRPAGFWQADGTVTKNTSSIAATATPGQYINVIAANKIDLTEYNTLVFNVVSKKIEGTGAYAALSVFTDTLKDTDAIARIPQNSIVIGDNQMDISAITGKYYVGFFVASDVNPPSLEVSEVYLL